MLWLFNIPLVDVYCVPVSVQCRLQAPLSAKRILRGAPVTVNSQKMRTRSGDCSELLLGNSNISSSSSDVVRDPGRSQHLFALAGRIPVTPAKQVDGNLNVERCHQILVAVASVGPEVIGFLCESRWRPCHRHGQRRGWTGGACGRGQRAADFRRWLWVLSGRSGTGSIHARESCRNTITLCQSWNQSVRARGGCYARIWTLDGATWLLYPHTCQQRVFLMTFQDFQCVHFS